MDNLENVLKRCEEINLVLNREKCHFMVKKGLVLGHRISRKDFAYISKPLNQLLQKEIPFIFDQNCVKTFEVIKEKLLSALIIITLNWSKPFIVMSDASDYAIGIALGQKRNNIFGAIHYASKTLNPT
ncbi:Retrovirus-related Pol polyprotein from transposon opus [Gossypium australe]|uniref:Retrovirus-related Pol polyprotein from transposon opus n=1 Tax=Gossypium australe TaxID=47621 RepID=A0A5B6WTQ1_9ROSI|nr:Retrovirus-related Pol polyprotein from transposon opus [Gossypium australe]